MIQALLDYLFNAVWQTPLAAAGALAFSRLARLSQRNRCLVFVGFLALAVILPAIHLRGPTPGQRIAAHTTSLPGHAAYRPTLGAIGQARAVEAAVSVRRPVAILLVGGALLLMAAAAARLFAGVRAAQGLSRRARPFTLSQALTERLQAFTGRSRLPLPSVRRTAEIASPAVVGAWPAVILVPETFDRLDEAQACAALLHECAHVIRRDYAFNLACELMTLPLSWHPAAHLMKARFRAAREIVCDRLAAAEMGSPARYARCLVELAQSVGQVERQRSDAAMALLGHGGLEGRVRELLAPDHGARRSPWPLTLLAAAGVAVFVGAPVALLHVDAALVRTVATSTRFVRGTAPRALARLDNGPEERSAKLQAAYRSALARGRATGRRDRALHLHSPLKLARNADLRPLRPAALLADDFASNGSASALNGGGDSPHLGADPLRVVLDREHDALDLQLEVLTVPSACGDPSVSTNPVAAGALLAANPLPWRPVDAEAAGPPTPAAPSAPPSVETLAPVVHVPADPRRSACMKLAAAGSSSRTSGAV